MPDSVAAAGRPGPPTAREPADSAARPRARREPGLRRAVPRPAAHRIRVLMAALGVVTACASCASATQSSTASETSAARVVVHGESEDATSVPSCNWPMSVSGVAPHAQLGLIGCYLRALAHESLSELAPLVVVHHDAPTTLTRAQLRHAGDAMKGRALVSITVNDSDPFDATATILFADHATAVVSMDALNVMEPASRSWRLNLGSSAAGPSIPSAAPSPSR